MLGAYAVHKGELLLRSCTWPCAISKPAVTAPALRAQQGSDPAVTAAKALGPSSCLSADDTNTRFVAEVGLSNEMAEMRIVGGGQVQATEPTDRAALIALMGLQHRHGNEQTGGTV